MPSCRHCLQAFDVTQDDLAFYETVSPVFAGKKELISPPTQCPDCRLQQRLLFRNELTLYHRKSDLTGKQIVSIFAQDKPYKVYDQDEWWGDQWDGLAYGRPFDFGRTFAEQFAEINAEIPHMSLFTTNAENSYFTNHSLNARNTYMFSGSTNIEDSLYGRFAMNCQNVVDATSLFSCQWCYECTACQGCYQCLHALYSYNCSDCVMIEDCQNCKNCCMCFGLKGQEYCFMNEHLTKDEYEARMKELTPYTAETFRLMRERFGELTTALPHRAMNVFASEHCSGDMVFNSKNCLSAFDCSGCEDCQYISNTPKGYMTRDCNYTAPEGDRFSYNIGSTVGVEYAMATFLVWYGNNVFYSRECHHCSDIFGCSGLKRKQYCVFNVQYTKEEYEALVPRIIDHMRKTQEWGLYLDPSASTMGYNETLAQEYFPLSKEEVVRNGWKWHDDEEKKDQYLGPSYHVPETIADVTDDITKQILPCDITGKPYKIIPQELKFYRTMGLPVPRKCPAQRQKERLAMRSPRKLWARQCVKCQKDIQTTYAPERPEIVYCESCYLETVY
jgi:hypothetical protein